MTRTFRAPGRVNLIGEHTDYNGGLVMPVAIDRETRVTVTPRAGNIVRVNSLTLNEQFEFDLKEAEPLPRGDWTDYVRGVALMLSRRGIGLRGADLTIDSNLPFGTGLSSSAALEVAVAYALLSLADLVIDPPEIARLCRQAENEFVGVGCGIMDQYASCCSRGGQALLLNCDTMAVQYLPVPETVRLVGCNTLVKHDLAASAYNDRRAECDEAADLFGLAHLSDVSAAAFFARQAALPETMHKRVRHVMTENARVKAAAAALESHDLSALGRAMNESHASLRDDFEVSCDELDLMVEIASAQPGVYGARMTGDGFGGCTINLVRADAVDEFVQAVPSAYFAQAGISPEVYVFSATSGAGAIDADAD